MGFDGVTTAEIFPSGINRLGDLLTAPKSIPPRARLRRPADPSTHRYLRKRALPSSYPFLADAGSCPGNCSGMEEATGAPSSFTVWDPKRLRASGRDGGDGHDRTPVAPQNAAFPTYKTPRRYVTARLAPFRGAKTEDLSCFNPVESR